MIQQENYRVRTCAIPLPGEAHPPPVPGYPSPVLSCEFQLFLSVVDMRLQFTSLWDLICSCWRGCRNSFHTVGGNREFSALHSILGGYFKQHLGI